MASIKCTQGGTAHTHSSVPEVRACQGKPQGITPQTARIAEMVGAGARGARFAAVGQPVPQDRKPNRFAGKCVRCSNGWVEAEQGWLAKDLTGKWAAEHKDDTQCVTSQPAPEASPRATAPDPALTPGVYRVDDVVYVVKPSREDKTRLYAKRLREINGDRLNEDGQHVEIEFDYERGAIFRIKPEHRLSLEEGKAYTLRYGRCICCGRHLKNGVSVERGIGPVCIKYFS